MTNAQTKTLEALKRDILEHDGRSCSDKYEFKKWEVTESEYPCLVFVISEVGLKGDEGTLASLLARTRRHISIGKRGGCNILNAKKGQKRLGYWNAIHCLTD